MAHGVTVSGGLSADDRADLDDLVQRYAQLVDQRAFAAVGDLFAPDAVLAQPDPPTATRGSTDAG